MENIHGTKDSGESHINLFSYLISHCSIIFSDFIPIQHCFSKKWCQSLVSFIFLQEKCLISLPIKMTVFRLFNLLHMAKMLL